MKQQIKNVLLYSLTASAFVLVGIMVAIFAFPQMIAFAIDDTGAARVEPSAVLSEQQAIYEQIYDAVAPSVVAISIQARQANDARWIPVSSGSGFVVDAQGHIVTNNHVVATAENVQEIAGAGAAARIEILMFDGTITSAEIVGTDPDSDIAVIRVNVPPERLVPVSFSNSNELDEGQLVFAVGNPFANNWTLTSGIISALNRSIPGLDTFSIGGVIQTDAAINPGNSGGPLVNLNGQVIGVNSQIRSESGSNSGVGFAVPSNLVIRVANALIEKGIVEYSYIGITGNRMSLSLIEAFDLPNNLRGVPVLQVSRNTPADNAGIRSLTNDGVDIIIAIDGIAIHDFDELIGYLGVNTQPGDTVIMTIYRNGQTIDLPVTLTDRP